MAYCSKRLVNLLEKRGKKYRYVTRIIVRRYMMENKTGIAAVCGDVWEIYLSDRSHEGNSDKNVHTTDHSKLNIPVL